LRFRYAQATGGGGFALVNHWAGVRAGIRRVCRWDGSGFGGGIVKPIFLQTACGFLLLPAPSGLMDLRGRRNGFVLHGAGTTVGDQPFDGYDHGERLDLAGNAASGHFRAQGGEFPETVQDLLAGGRQPGRLLGFLLGFARNDKGEGALN
jgi:hypothetical protein